MRKPFNSKHRPLKSGGGFTTSCDAYVAQDEEQAIHAIYQERGKLRRERGRKREVAKMVLITLAVVKWGS